SVLAVSSMGSSGCAVITGWTISARTGSVALTPSGARGWSAPTRRTSRSETMPTRRSTPSSPFGPWSRIGKWRMLRCSMSSCTSRMGVSGPMATTWRVMISRTSIFSPRPRLPGDVRRAGSGAPQAVELLDHLRRRLGADARHQGVGGAGAHVLVAGGVELQARRAVEALEHAAVGHVGEAAAAQVVVPGVQGGEHHGGIEAPARERLGQQALGP